MLGYVQIDRGELKVREYEIYCGYYCGVCKSIGRRYGQLPRMALSYDAAFLAIILAALEDTPDAPTPEHCIGHRIKKKTIIRNKAIDYAADVMLILAWYKLLDDAHDEGKLSAKLTAGFLKGIYKKLHSRHPALCSGIEEHLHRLTSLEKEKCAQLDLAAEAFSKIMEIIFTEGARTVLGEADSESKNENTFDSSSPDDSANAQETPQTFLTIDETLPSMTPQTALAKVGYHMGKWIYLMDAIDDIEENLESGAYNPLLYRFDFDAQAETPAEFRQRIENDLKFNLYHYLAMVGNYVNSLDIKKNQGIIENVIYFGLNRKTEEILSNTDPREQV